MIDELGAGDCCRVAGGSEVFSSQGGAPAEKIVAALNEAKETLIAFDSEAG